MKTPFLIICTATAIGFGAPQIQNPTDGFTRSPTEHIINEVDRPFLVRSVKGSVVLREGGTPLPDVLIEIRGPGDSARVRRARTDGRGRFKLPGVPRGNYKVKTTCPGNPLTREEMSVFIIGSLYVALQGPNNIVPLTGWPVSQWKGTAGPNGQYFTDVAPGSTYYNFIQQMAYLGITSGCGGSKYCPSSPTTNVEMAVFTMFAREYVLTGSALASFNYPSTPCFTDVPSTDPYFKFVQGVAGLQVIPYPTFIACPPSTGTPFREGNDITRAQAAPYAVRGILGEESY